MYAGIVSRVTNFREIKGADRIQLASVTVMNVPIAEIITGKDVTDNTLGVYFGADCQLSEEYCNTNKLLKRDGGYLDNDKRRITAQRFKGVKSEGLWLVITPEMQAQFLENAELSEGDKIGEPICKRYPLPLPKQSNQTTSARIRSNLNFPEHYDTEQLVNAIPEIMHIPVGATVTITSKYHGTSHRVGNIRVPVELPQRKHVINWIYNKFTRKTRYLDYEYKNVHGSRKVILDDAKPGYYGSNQFRYDAVGDPLLFHDELVFGEIVGYTQDNATIMPKHDPSSFKDLRKYYNNHISYTYGVENGKAQFYVYRIARFNGLVWIDLSFAEMQQRAKELGYNVPNVLYTGIYDGNAQSLVSLAKQYCESVDGIFSPEYDHIREGVVIRLDYEGKHKAYKYKSYGFRLMEHKEEIPDA